MLSGDRGRRVDELFDKTSGMSPKEVEAFLEDSCADDPEVRDEVRAMRQVPVTFLNPSEQSPFVPGYGRQFERKRPIGYGSSGVVWEAYDHKLFRSVAIKFIHEATAVELSSLKNEARIASKLQHPGIVTIYDAHFEGEEPSVVMSLVNGPTLQELMQTGIIGQARALDILQQAADALDYAHAEGTVHRDIKPANLMLHEKSRVMITDFGIARQHLAPQETLPGWLKGTPAYMSPEQRAANPKTHPVTPRSDQYSLAIVAYEILTGNQPPLDVLAKAADGKLRARDRVLRRALSERPEDRYENCTDFVKELRLALNTAEANGDLPERRTPPVFEPPRIYTQTSATSRTKWKITAIACAVLLLVIILALAWAATHRPVAPSTIIIF
jgi:serine/threonine-protein kinase